MKTLIEKLRQNKMAMCLFIIAFVLIVTGVTYGVFETFIKGEKEHVININQIKFAYYEKSGGLSLDNNSILSIEDGKNQTSYFDFDISLTTDNETNIMYNIVLEEDTSSTLDNSKVKVYLTDQNNVTIKNPLSISDLVVDESNYRILYSTTISSGQTQNYRLRAWIDKTQDLYVKTNENGNHVTTLERASYKFKVNVYTIDQDLTAVETLMLLKDNQSNSGLYTITHEADSTLQIGTTESVTEYRYRGASTKNYVTFNNETWRIIGIFPTDDGTGKIENRIKIIKDQSIGNKYWDTGNSNNWARPATLNTELNTTYLNSLDSTSKNMIGNTKYYLGGKNPTPNNGYVDTPLQFYSYERKIQNTTSNEFYNGTNPNSWVGKLGLMYLSDYGYASSNCENKKLYDANSSSNDIRACNTTNWLYNIKVDELLLPQRASDSSRAFYVRSVGFVYDVYASDDQLAVRPVLYLTSSVKIAGGNGTIGSPYTLGL